MHEPTKAYLKLDSLGQHCSPFIQRASSAVPLGFGLFVVGWVCLLVVAFGFPYSTHYSKGFVALFSLVPWNLLSKGIQDLAAASEGKSACPQVELHTDSGLGAVCLQFGCMVRTADEFQLMNSSQRTPATKFCVCSDSTLPEGHTCCKCPVSAPA